MARINACILASGLIGCVSMQSARAASLRYVEDQAIANSPGLEGLRHTQEAVAADGLALKYKIAPELVASHFRSGPAPEGDLTWQINSTVKLEAQFGNPLRWLSDSRAQEARVSSANLKIMLRRLEIIESVRVKFYKVCLLIAKRDQAQTFHKISEDILRLSRDKFRTGLGQDVDVSRARLEVLRQEKDQRALELELAAALTELEVISGVNRRTLGVPTDGLPRVFDLSVVSSQMDKSDKSSVKILEQSEKELRANLLGVRGAFLPDVSIAYGLSDNSAHQRSRQEWTLGFTWRLGIGSYYRNNAAEKKLFAVGASLSQARRDQESERESLQGRALVLGGQLDRQREMVDLQSRVVEQVRKRYEAGLVGQRDYNGDYRRLLQEQASLHELRYEATVVLAKAARSWENDKVFYDGAGL